MYLLDFPTAKLSLHIHHSRLVGERQHLESCSQSSFKSFKIPTYNFNLRCLRMGCGRGVIKSVATANVGNKVLVQDVVFEERLCDSYPQQGIGSENMKMEELLSSEESVELEEKERLRRIRISEANKGNTPWNKGRKHSPETIRKIRERTRLAMQNPKVKMKLTTLGHAQSQETKLKIGASVRLGWEKRRNRLKLQETCHFEWQNLIAECSRNGMLGEQELSWDSYGILDEKLLKEWLDSVELRKKARKVKSDRRAPKSAEQKKRISQAISAKWNDPAYRSRVCSALAKYHGIAEESERKPKRKVNSKRTTRSVSPNLIDSASLADKNKSHSSSSRPRKRKEPSYKDPLVSCKLEMIKNIRAERVTADARKTKAIEQARLLIAEAEKAANALEVAARTNLVARASLVEARKLIKEATESLELINTQSLASVAGPKNSSYNSNKLPNRVEKERNSGIENMNKTDQPQNVKINSTHAASDTNSQHMLAGQEKLYPHFNRSNGNVIPANGTRPPSSSSDTSVKSQKLKKTWIKGRLVEVVQGS